jgi:hypothetical protein
MKNTKHLVTAMIIVAFSFLAIASTDEQVEQDISGISPEVTISAQQLVLAYDANEVAADEKYNGKVIAVSGVVEEIGKDFTDSIYVSLSSGDDSLWTSVQCSFGDSHKSAAAGLSKGEYVTIKGKCDGLLGNVAVSGSSLVE